MASGRLFTLGDAANDLTGSAGLTKAGLGTLSLGFANNFSGAWTISGGTVTSAAAGALGNHFYGPTVTGCFEPESFLPSFLRRRNLRSVSCKNDSIFEVSLPRRKFHRIRNTRPGRNRKLLR